MSRSLKLYCNDILISCDKIIRYTQLPITKNTNYENPS